MIQCFADAAAAQTAAASTQAAASTEGLLSLGGLFTLGMLILLQIVLGFDNLLYISIESKRVPPESQSKVRKIGISLAIIFRIVLLFVVVQLVSMLQEALISIDTYPLTAAISGHSLIVLGGGAFILYTAIKEIYHMLAMDDLEHGADKKPGSVGKAITLIVIMNLVFSFDSILSAMALTKSFAIMATAIVISGMLMIYLADKVADFLQKNRMYEVLGLFVLFIVGIMLISEGGHIAELAFFGHHVTPMAKSTFYFVLAVLLVVDIVQSKYQKNLLAARQHAASQVN